MSYEKFKIHYRPWLMAKTANSAKEAVFERPNLAKLAALAISHDQAQEKVVSGNGFPELVLDVDECAAHAEIGGEVPAIYARAFAEMQVRPLRTMSVDRWRETVNDAGLFLDEWGPTAEKAGWTAEDLFGAHGIVWALNGKPLAALDHNRAILPTGRRVDRPSSRRRAG
jgi:hypothetical protein